LTVEERAPVIARYSNMRFRSFTWSLVFTPWVKADTPEELVAAVTARLLEDSLGKPES
jgi:hypothetical protein